MSDGASTLSDGALVIGPKAFTIDDNTTLSDNYEKLKKEAIFYANVGASAFVLMALRLKKIKDEELYKQDKYEGFIEFVENEIKVTRQSVHQYISLIDVFGVNTFKEDFPHSKLIPFIPIFNASDKKIPQQKKIVSKIRLLVISRMEQPRGS